ncbi:phage tail domain-containing protein [Niallia sp. 03190]|uniref:phage tail domain-containing protein n=1 Tax=Niallia sp. 03190 TaxID=3458061 RepID=UPI004044354D
MRYLKIIKNGQVIDHRELNIELLFFRRGSLIPTNSSEIIEGKHGLEDTGTVFGGRRLIAGFLVRGFDDIDYDLLIDEIYDLFETEVPMLLIDSKQPGKQWTVKVDTEFTLESLGASNSIFTVDFISPYPYSRSLGATLIDPMDFDSEKWQAVAGGLDLSDDMKYSFNSTNFRVCNGGVFLDPRQLPLVIKFKGASNNLQIKNLTTGDVFSYTGTTSAGDTIELNSVRHLKNGVNIFSKTNHKRISLKNGWNEFQITGTTSSFTITFEFNFWYK